MTMSPSATRRRPIVLGGLALIVLGGAGAFLLVGPPRGEGTSPAAGSTSQSGSPIGNTSAPAPNEETDQPSTVSTEPAGGVVGTSPGPSASASPSATPAALRSVGVNATYSGWDPGAGDVVAGGFVADVIENGGTCTLTLTRDGVVVSGSAEATADATTTSCGEMRAGDPALVSGTWDAVVSYASDRSTGQSAVFSVVIP
jgi:hypothetical protein